MAEALRHSVDEWRRLQVPCWYREIARTSLVEAFGPEATFDEATYGFFRPQEGSNRFVWYESKPNAQIKGPTGGHFQWPWSRASFRDGRLPVCLVRTFSRSELEALVFSAPESPYPPAQLAFREVDPTSFVDKAGPRSRLRYELGELYAANEANTEDLKVLGERLAAENAKSIRVALLSSLDAPGRLRLERNPTILPNPHAYPFPSGWSRGCLSLLADWAVKERVPVLAVLTRIPVACLSAWVYEDTRKAVREAIGREIGAIDGELPLLQADPRAGIKYYLDLWNEQRELFKPRLEALIQVLAECEYPTYADKAGVATELHALMMAWGFRAVSPKTGRPAYLRCHQQDGVNPHGCFQFRDITGADPVAPPAPNAQTTSVRLPRFTLTGAPPDRRKERNSEIAEP